MNNSLFSKKRCHKNLTEEEKDEILLVYEGASWYKLIRLKIPENIEIIHIPPYTPET